MNPKKSECGIECREFVYDALERKAICKKCGRVVTMKEVIEGLKGAIKTAEYTDVEEACKIAILISQEQEERSNGCEYCKGAKLGDILVSRRDGDTITYKHRALCCPECGRRLEE